MGCIYSITNIINNKKYIGQTARFNKRRAEHLTELRTNKHSNQHLQKAFNLYGESLFEIVILEECDDSNLDEREEYWIKYFSSTNKSKGYNIMPGGFSSRGYHPDTTYITDEYRKAVSERQREYFKTHSPVGLGVKRPQYVRDKISDILKEKYSTGEIINPNKIKAACLNDGMVFDSYTEAADYYGIRESSIAKHISNNTNFVKVNDSAYVFVRYIDYVNMTNEEISQRLSNAKEKLNSVGGHNRKRVYCFETDTIYDSATEAGRQLSIDHSTISKCCNGKVKCCGGIKTENTYTFKYI